MRRTDALKMEVEENEITERQVMKGKRRKFGVFVVWENASLAIANTTEDPIRQRKDCESCFSEATS